MWLIFICFEDFHIVNAFMLIRDMYVFEIPIKRSKQCGSNLYTVRKVSMLSSSRGPPPPSASPSSILTLCHNWSPAMSCKRKSTKTLQNQSEFWVDWWVTWANPPRRSSDQQFLTSTRDQLGQLCHTASYLKSSLHALKISHYWRWIWETACQSINVRPGKSNARDLLIKWKWVQLSIPVTRVSDVMGAAASL